MRKLKIKNNNGDILAMADAKNDGHESELRVDLGWWQDWYHMYLTIAQAVRLRNWLDGWIEQRKGGK